jgi:hypothetical protein
VKKVVKEKKRRSQVKNPALVKKYNHRLRQEYLDYDYLDKLNDDELKWLNKFTEEYNNASLVLDDDNNVVPEANLHKTNEYKKEIYDANNARNRCLYGQLRNKGDKFNNTRLMNYDNLISDVEEHLSKDSDPKFLENAFIDYIDNEQIKAMLTEYDESMLAFSEVSEYLE